MSSKSNSVMATLITYNPDKDVLTDNLTALCGQIKKVLVYDNASDNIEDIRIVVNGFNNVILCENEDNEGLPLNYNRAAKIAEDEGYEWLLIMDQDTIVPPNLIESFMKYSEDGQVAIATPYIWSLNYQEEEEAYADIPDEPITIVDRCISSASMNRVSVIKELGGFKEFMFIDDVDTEFCKNVAKHGYKIIRVNECVIKHRLGAPYIKHILGRDITLSGYPAFRYYYIIRNHIYIARKYKTSFAEETFFLKNFVKWMVKFPLEDQTMTKYKMAIKGIKDGFKL